MAYIWLISNLTGQKQHAYGPGFENEAEENFSHLPKLCDKKKIQQQTR